MQNKVKGFFLIVVFLISVCPGFCFGQINPDQDKQGKISRSDQFPRFYNVTTFIPLTFDGQFFNGAQTICGYRITRKLFVGGGIGYEGYGDLPTYEDFRAYLSLLPVFADIRYTVLSGKISPVVAVNGGYKFLLNKASTQTRYDTVYSSILTVSARDDYADYNIFKQGGPFITAEAGISARVYKQIAIYFSFDYTLSSISGDYHLSDKYNLLGSDNVWRVKTSSENIDRSLAYIHSFFLRLGIVF